MRYLNLNEVLELHERVLAQILNGFEITKSTDEQEMIILRVASGQLDRKAFTDWFRESILERK